VTRSATLRPAECTPIIGEVDGVLDLSAVPSLFERAGHRRTAATFELWPPDALVPVSIA